MASSSAWVVDMEKSLKDADAAVEKSLWQRHSIYRVPSYIKNLNPKAYRPQVVSLGPFHHGEPELRPMEKHKRRALSHLLRRVRRPLEEFRVAVEEIADELESAYMDLGAEWRGAGRERFLEMMIVDGCFLLEVLAAGTGHIAADPDYEIRDPIFSSHALLHMVPYIRRDMLMLENQLPLLLLKKLVAVNTGRRPKYVNARGHVIERFLGLKEVLDTTSACLKEALDGSSSVPAVDGPGC
ncbi:hypothetical protein ACP4OV_027240 [Aristida adscensionis]